MAANKVVKEHKKIAVDETTYEILKTFARFNGLKVRVVLKTLAEMVTENEEFGKQVVELAVKKQADDTNSDFN